MKHILDNDLVFTSSQITDPDYSPWDYRILTAEDYDAFKDEFMQFMFEE